MRRTSARRSSICDSDSTPFADSPAIAPMTARPRGVFATSTVSGFDVAANRVTTSGTSRIARRRLIGNAFRTSTMNAWPAPIRRAFRIASSRKPGSVPSPRTRQGPDASQNPRPNWTPGTLFAIASYRSSGVLMKWACPTITFTGSGFWISTSWISMECRAAEGKVRVKGFRPAGRRMEAVRPSPGPPRKAYNRGTGLGGKSGCVDGRPGTRGDARDHGGRARQGQGDVDWNRGRRNRDHHPAGGRVRRAVRGSRAAAVVYPGGRTEDRDGPDPDWHVRPGGVRPEEPEGRFPSSERD